jgi:hypothetical protein
VKRAAAALALGLSACTAAPEPAGPGGPLVPAPDPEGIAVQGSPLRIDFGRAQAGVIAAVARLEGRGPAATVDCAGGVSALRWDSGLTLHFRGGAFLGWARPDGTSAGIPCGG